MILTDSRQSYLNHVASLKTRLDEENAARAAVGGEFAAIGTLEHDLLCSLGLSDGDCVIDVGCGSGRLAYQLARYERLRYVGTDVVPDLLEHAAQVSRRPDWQFTVANGTSIPVESECADFVCFFSVFTHLVHEQTFRYLREAKRALRPGGQIVFSFLEFRIPCHWDQFQENAAHSNSSQHLNQFIDREAIQVWADRLGLCIEQIADGDRPHIPLSTDVEFDAGQVMHGMGNLGQSVAVLRRPTSGWVPFCARRAGPPSAIAGASQVGGVTPTPCAGFSARGHVARGDAVLIMGFEVRTVEQPALIRAIGPGLRARGISEPLERPHLELYDASGLLVLQTADAEILTPSARVEIARATATADLPPATPGDLVLLVTLLPGSYTVVVRGRDNAVGNVLAEIYLIDERTL